MYSAGIVGTGHMLPEKVLTNADLETLVETSDDWIMTRTGIRERHIAGVGETTSMIASAAAQQAMDAAGLKANEIDLILCATVCPDMALPSTACFIQSRLGAKKAAAYDLVAACSGFLYGVTTANAFIATGQAKNVLVIGAEILSRYVDYTDRSTCVIFGDGAGAAIMTRVEAGRGILASRIQSDGDFADYLFTPGGGTLHPASEQSLENRLHFIKMRGNELFKVAVRSMTETSRQVLDEVKMTAADIDLLIPHQANQRITDAVADRLQIPATKVYSNISRIGNTSSASIPIALDECVRSGRVQRGNVLMFSSFGAGATWGSMVVRW